MTSRTSSGPLRIDAPPGHGARATLLRLIGPAVERLLGFSALNELYARIDRRDTDRPFVDRALEVLDVSYELTDDDRRRIPRTGPVVVVANHPFGGLEGMILLSILRQARPDVKLLGNAVLRVIPEMRESLLFAHRFGAGATPRNVPAMRAAMRWLDEGGALGVFPAGRVSHLQLRRARIADGPWNPTIARLIRRSRSPVLPVYFQGANSLRFQLLGLVHPRLRTLMLPREMLRKRRSRIPVRCGDVVPVSRLETIEDDRAMIRYLRMRTDILKSRSDNPHPRPSRANGNGRVLRSNPHAIAPLAAPAEPAALAEQIDALPAEQVMLRQGSLSVVHAHASQIPDVLREIGRLREMSFRHVGQGTGNPVDLHAIDQHYVHLIAWNAERGEIVGSYRMGPTDQLLPRFGKRGLFTSTIFHYDEALLEQIDPALELGRAFVRPEYQRDYAPLLMLWKGVGRYVAAHPQYRMLFGSVSIGDEYQSLSKQLLMAFLELNRDLPDVPGLSDLRRFVHTSRPIRRGGIRAAPFPFAGTIVNDIREVDELISQIEADGRGMPVLLRQYLKLGARVLGFSGAATDQADREALHALVLADLTRADPAVLARYVGRDRVNAFLAHHRCAVRAGP